MCYITYRTKEEIKKNFQMFRIKPNDHHYGITRSGNYIPATVGFLDPPERLFNLKGEMTYDVPECIWRKLI
jgi:hypothetical protein